MAPKLSEQDTDILAHAYLRAEESVAEIAKSSGYREHVVRRSLKRLRDNEIIKPVAILNPYVLGFTEYYTFFSVENSEASRRKAIHVLTEAPEVFWVGETGASFQFSVAILARGAKQFTDLLSRICGQLGPILRDKRVSICHSFYLLSPPARKRDVIRSHLWYGDTGIVSAIDPADHKIIRALVKEPLQGTSAVARKVGLPATTVDYRIETLRRRGVLVGFQYLPDFARLDLAPFPIALYLRDSCPETQAKILKFAKSSGNVNYVAFLFGRWDAELGVRVKYPSEIPGLLDQLNKLLGSNLTRVEFYPDFKYHKLEYYPFESLPLL